MGVVIAFGLGLLFLAFAGGGKGNGNGAPTFDLSPSEEPFETPRGPVLRDRWVGPWRLVVYQDAGITGEGGFGYIAVTNLAAIDEGVEAQEMEADGFSSASMAENAGVTAVSGAQEVRTENGLVLFPLQEFQRDSGEFYRSFMAKAGANTGLLATERVADPQSTTGTMTRYKLYDRKGWPSTAALEGSADTDSKMFATVAGFLKEV